MVNSPIVSRINGLLAEKGISKRDFYRDCRITSASYSLWKKRKTTPRMKNLEVIAEYLGTTTDYLLTGLGEKEKAPTQEGEHDFAQNDHEEDMLLLARHMAPIPEEDRQALKEQFKNSIDLYLKAKGISDLEVK